MGCSSYGGCAQPSEELDASLAQVYVPLQVEIPFSSLSKKPSKAFHKAATGSLGRNHPRVISGAGRDGGGHHDHVPGERGGKKLTV